MDDPADAHAHLHATRRSYDRGALWEADLAPTWLEQLTRWLDDAAQVEPAESNAMVLGTADADGRPSARTVLLKAADDRGLVFYTNLRSGKARDLAANPRASLLFAWRALQRQVIVLGAVEHVDVAEADAYFASRPRGSQLGALASPQSEPIGDRATLERAWAELAADYADGRPVGRPGHWGGLRVVPDSVEFWQGRPDRLHDRLRYRRPGDGERAWIVERLAP